MMRLVAVAGNSCLTIRSLIVLEETTLHKTKRHCTRMAALQSLSPWKRKRKKRNKVITTQGIRIWSPSQVLFRGTGLNFVERTKHVAVLVV